MVKIQDVDLKFNGSLTPIKSVKKIVVHHPAHPTWDIHDIHHSHQSKGWDGIGYNYFVTKDGKVQKGRGMYVGAHCKGYNSTTLGISFQGNFEIETPTNVQLRAGAQLIAQLLLDTGLQVHDIIGHKDLAATVCPGKNFSVNVLRTYVLEYMNPKAKVEQAPQEEVKEVSPVIKTGGLTAEMVKEISEYFIVNKFWAQIQFTSDGKNPTAITGGLTTYRLEHLSKWLNDRNWYFEIVK
jgi:hypothetical protein